VLVAALAAGCSGDPPVSLDVTTPAASATAGSAPPPATAGRRPPPPAPVDSVPSGPPQVYQALVGDWQRSRSAFFAAVSSGESSTVATQRALAARFLAAERAFGAGLGGTDWPAAARPAVRALLDRVRAQQATIAAMAAAGSKGEFTARLADYGVAAGPENAAVTAVARVLH
jgi:hypothetical protein